jgi:hypothetical protein
MSRRDCPRRSGTAALLALALAMPAVAEPTAPATPTSISGQQAAEVFERLKSLAGRWRERSTKGWTGGSTYRVIAAGSAVMSSFDFDDDPGNAHSMVTIFTLDGDRLLLTHYCEARNQPRLVASAVSADGRTVTFTFLDGGNLRSREQGHMDKAVYTFVDDDHFTDRWTWYADGKERWLEEIVNERVAPAVPGGGGSGR